MAEDLQAVSVHLVTTAAGRMGTDTRDLVGVAWAAVDELHTRVEALERMVMRLTSIEGDWDE